MLVWKCWKCQNEDFQSALLNVKKVQIDTRATIKTYLQCEKCGAKFDMIMSIKVKEVNHA